MKAPSVPIVDPPCPYPAYVHEHRDIAGVRIEVAVGIEAAEKLLPSILDSGIVPVDIETFGLGDKRWRVKAVGIGDATGTKVAILDPRDDKQAALIRDTLDKAQTILLHHAAFDSVPLVHCGLLALDDIDKIIDTLVIARLARPGKTNKLEVVGQEVIGLASPGSAWTGLRGGQWSADRWYTEGDLGMARYIDGLAADVSVTARIYLQLLGLYRQMSTHAPWWSRGEYGLQGIANREIVISRMMLRRSAIGLPADLGYADAFRDRYSVDVQTRTARLESAGISHSTPSTMAKWLEDNGIVDAKWKRTDKGAISTDKKILKQVAHRLPVVADYLTVRSAVKVFGYLDTIASDKAITGLVHPSVNVDSAITGRMSISNPALQQFPPAARGILISPYEAGLASIDWSAIESVMAGGLGHDVALLTAIANGLDPYSLAMEAAGIDRKTAKVVILAGQYGQGVPSLARALGIPEDEAKVVREKVFASMPGVKHLMDTTRQLAERGYVSTISGRAVPITHDGRRYKSYLGTNYCVQGSAYDLLAESLLKINAAGLRDHVYLAVHDELVVEDTPEVTAAVSEIMSTPPDYLKEHVGDLPLTLTAEPESLGDRWGKPGESTDLTTYTADTAFED